jgi:hypothetical protein
MKPTIGRIVHFVQKKPEQYGSGVVHLPAIITAVWGDSCVNLQVFTDGSNSEPGPNANPPSTKWITSATLDASGQQPMSWHWPEKVVELEPLAVGG